MRKTWAGGDGIVLVTGQSGVAIKACWEKLTGEQPVSVEGEIPEESGMRFIEFLCQPEYVQFEYWSRAFKSASSKAEESGCLTFHATYYHQKKRELFSPVDFNVIRSLTGKVRMVVVFVDDIYDVYRRLMGPDQMYEDILDREKTDPLGAIFSSVFNVISLLNWREMEISFSRTIANLLGAKMFVVSTKHPDFMFRKLVERRLDDLRIYYLSHPITAIREEADEFLGSFIGKLEILIEAVLEAPDLVLFFPTTIDELIIKREKIGEHKYHYYPELGRRWGHPCKDKLLSPPLSPALRAVEPLNPLKYQLSGDKTNPVNQAVSCFLSLLWDYIYLKQTISRDYTLVEQCKNGVIACRPFFEGDSAGGVMGELSYNFLLMGKQPDRRAIVFSTKEDRNRWAIRRLFQQLTHRLTSLPPNLASVGAQWESTGVEVWESDASSIRGRLENDLLSQTYDFKATQSQSAWTGNGIARKLERKAQVFAEIFQNIKTDSILTEATAAERIHGQRIAETERLVYENWSQDRFWREVQQWVSENLINPKGR